MSLRHAIAEAAAREDAIAKMFALGATSTELVALANILTVAPTTDTLEALRDLAATHITPTQIRTFTDAMRILTDPTRAIADEAAPEPQMLAPGESSACRDCGCPAGSDAALKGGFWCGHECHGAEPQGEPSDSQGEVPSHWTLDDRLSDLHARYHDMPGNWLGRSECGYENCDFWDAAEFALRAAGGAR